jgi:DNA polymerase III epsilon subunit-like protein
MKIKPSDRQIVVDLETLSARPNSCIISIGAVAFTLQDGITEEFFINVDPLTCKEIGLHISKETVAWWASQPKEAIESWQKDPVPLKEAMQKFTEFYGNTSVPIWGNGSSFDITILESAYFALNDEMINIPWKFWDIYDMRTLTSILGRRLEKTGINHNALHDSIAEAKLIIDMLSS